MKCPHCLHAIKPGINTTDITSHNKNLWKVENYVCPNCDKEVLVLERYEYIVNRYVLKDSRLIYPRGLQNQPIPSEVDDSAIISDYEEACLVLVDSPKSSAALTRRCLQYILREKMNTKSKDLNDQIQEVIDTNQLPGNLSEGLNTVRIIGNFAAHTQKSVSTGEIVDVEPHEAEWNLEVLYELMDYLFVRPANFQKKKDLLNQKLIQVGKPTI